MRGDRNWNLRAALDQLTGGKRSGVAATFIHELGHQVHYWAGAPLRPSGMRELTVYSGENHKEWHAEHFAAWLFNRAALERWDQNVTQYFDNLVERATTSTTKGPR